MTDEETTAMGDVENLREWMGRMEGKLDRAVDDLAQIKAQWAIRPCAGHEDRIRALEQFKWRTVGIVSLLSATPGLAALVALFFVR